MEPVFEVKLTVYFKLLISDFENIRKRWRINREGENNQPENRHLNSLAFQKN